MAGLVPAIHAFVHHGAPGEPARRPSKKPQGEPAALGGNYSLLA